MCGLAKSTGRFTDVSRIITEFMTPTELRIRDMTSEFARGSEVGGLQKARPGRLPARHPLTEAFGGTMARLRRASGAHHGGYTHVRTYAKEPDDGLHGAPLIRRNPPASSPIHLHSYGLVSL